MKFAYATTLVFVYWLIVATSYWTLSHYAQTHTNLECSFDFIKHRDGKQVWLKWYDWHKEIKDDCKHIKTHEINNVYFCINTKSTHYLTRNISICRKSCSYHFFSQIKHQLSSPIKWWEGICFEKERSNASINARKYYVIV